jgi:hypothetical protein
MVEPGAPGQVPKSKGVPKDVGVPPEKGVPPRAGVPKAQGVPRDVAVLPGTPGKRLPGDPGQVPRGAEGQLDKAAPNPWAPKPDTVVDDVDAILPPSSPDRAETDT